jgi:predicted DNA-binding transcriptional regulator AlpA
MDMEVHDVDTHKSYRRQLLATTETEIAARSNSPLLPARNVLKRYDIADRTLDRWLNNELLGFPRPIVINKRRYFRECELQDWERARATAKSEAA